MIRRATPSDAAAIAAIWNTAIRDTTVTFTATEKSQGEVAKLLTDATPCFVVQHATRVVGFARYFPFRGGDGYRFSAEHTVMLAQTAQGQGAGRALMGALFDHAQSSGKHTLHACISGENTDAIAFHAKLGFTTLAVLPQVGFKFGRWIDLVIMQKRL